MTAVYGRIAPCATAYGRIRLSQLYNLTNSKCLNLFYFILFMLGHLDELDQGTVSILILFDLFILVILNDLDELDQKTVSILIYFI